VILLKKSLQKLYANLQLSQEAAMIL